MLQQRGFTLIELLLVIVLIAILSTLALTAYGNSKSRSKLARVTTELGSIASAANQYALDNGNQYPPSQPAGTAPGFQAYLSGGTWPTSVWPKGIFEWDNLTSVNGQPVSQILQVDYRLCSPTDAASYCSDPYLFPHFTANSSIYYCMQGSCVVSPTVPTAPGYCVNCKTKPVNPPL